MNEDARRELQLQLQQLRDGFALAIPEKMSEIEAVWSKVQSSGGPDHESAKAEFQMLYRMAHTLVGNSGTFGFKDLS